MANANSFVDMLRQVLKRKPQRILEWGPGNSTLMMNKMCPDSEVISIEHLEWYYNEWKDRIKSKILLIPDVEGGTMPRYTNPPVKGKFDLIFVDGRQRVRCMKRALKLLSKNGVVMLHDAERKEYKEGIALYNVIGEGDGTLCLKPKSQ